MTTATQRHNGRAKRHNGHDGHLQARLNSLKGDIGNFKRDVRGLVSDAEDQFDSAVKSTVKSARDAKARVETWGNQNVKTVRRTVKKQPFLACMIAAGAGALLGLFMSMGRSRRESDDCE